MQSRDVLFVGYKGGHCGHILVENCRKTKRDFRNELHKMWCYFWTFEILEAHCLTKMFINKIFKEKKPYIWELNSAKEGAKIVFDLFIHLKIYLNFLGIHEKNIEKKGTI